jgi:hypothetical protein
LAIGGDHALQSNRAEGTLEMVINAHQAPSRAAPEKIPFKSLTTVRESLNLYYYN